VVVQQSEGEAGLGVEDEDQPGTAGETARGVLVETGGDLDGEDGRPDKMRRLDVDLALDLRYAQAHRRRQLHRAVGQGTKRLLRRG
jgi:hypothetical protein